MGTKRAVCAVVFWFKAFAAFALAVAVMAGLCIEITHKFNQGQIDKLAERFKKSGVTIDPNSAECSFDTNGRLARLEPNNGYMMYGYHLRWTPDNYPIDIVRKTGKGVPVFNAFIQMDATSFRRDDLMAHASDAARVGANLEVTVEPIIPINELPDQVINDFAETCKTINSEFGLGVYLRFGHEMNGGWTIYGLRPVAYREGFIRMANAIRARTNMTAMVWAPNIGVAYPFTARTPVNPETNTYKLADELAALDTNGNGALDASDDPYGPYYPGDEYVDWIGISLYWYPSPRSRNLVPPNDFAASYLDGSTPAAGGASNRRFYQRFVQSKGKPLMFAESGAPYMRDTATADSPSEISIKTAWWQQVMSPEFHQRFPGLKLFVNFEDSKIEDRVYKNWAIHDDPAITAAFNEYMDLPAVSEKFLWADRAAVGCNGRFK